MRNILQKIEFTFTYQKSRKIKALANRTLFRQSISNSIYCKEVKYLMTGPVNQEHEVPYAYKIHWAIFHFTFFKGRWIHCERNTHYTGLCKYTLCIWKMSHIEEPDLNSSNIHIFKAVETVFVFCKLNGSVVLRSADDLSCGLLQMIGLLTYWLSGISLTILTRTYVLCTLYP